MRITIVPGGDGSLITESELQVAIQILRGAAIQVDGGGIVGRAGKWVGVILLHDATDSARER